MAAVPEPAPESREGDEPPFAGPSQLRAVITTARPKQWIKNVLVFAAPAAAGVLNEADAIAKTLITFVAFCLAASATYLLNDAADAEADRLHPTKRSRPIAAATCRRASPGALP